MSLSRIGRTELILTLLELQDRLAHLIAPAGPADSMTAGLNYAFLAADLSELIAG